MTSIHETSRNLRRKDLENIVTKERGSFVALIVDEDPAYVVGYFADVRGMPVATELTRWRKEDIALRIQIRDELRPNLDAVSYSHRKTDNS